MIWSSPDRSPVRGGSSPESEPASWDWDEIGSPHGSPLVDQADLNALHEAELEAAYRRGRADGEQAAQARARKEVQTVVAAARQALQQVREARETWSRQLEENLVALSTAVARQILDRELVGDEETVRALVRKAAATFPMNHSVKVRLHPSDLARLTATDGGETPDAEGREARWVADEDIVPGGCVVEGPDRIVDGRVDAALERIYWELTHGG